MPSRDKALTFLEHSVLSYTSVMPKKKSKGLRKSEADKVSPEWWSNDLKEMLGDDPPNQIEALAIADTLEGLSKQLRGLNRPKVELELTSVFVAPEQKRTLLEFASLFKNGEDGQSDKQKVALAAMWVLMEACRIPEIISKALNKTAAYMKAEGFNDAWHISEPATAVAREAWVKKIGDEDLGDDED